MQDNVGPISLPLGADDAGSWDSASLANALAGLGYPGFRHLAAGIRANPAVILLAAISCSIAEVRVMEGLPWLVLEYCDLDWDWLVREAKLRAAQNRLGFVVTLSRRVAEKGGLDTACHKLREVETELDRSRLAHEDTFCQESLSAAERAWLRQVRSADARHWNLLTDLDAERLPYAA